MMNTSLVFLVNFSILFQCNAKHNANGGLTKSFDAAVMQIALNQIRVPVDIIHT